MIDIYMNGAEVHAETPEEEREQSLEIQDCLHPPETDELLNRLTIKAALDRLPAELREVIILYYFQELKLTEISSTLQIGLPLVKYRVKQAYHK